MSESTLTTETSQTADNSQGTPPHRMCSYATSFPTQAEKEQHQESANKENDAHSTK